MVTAAGAISQAAIGIGFSLLTVPFYLLLFDAHDAVQLAIILTIAITVIMLTKIGRDANRYVSRNLLIGSVIGFPLGLIFFIYADAAWIKVAVAASILIALAATEIRTKKSLLTDNRNNAISAGVVSGAMVTAIAMAGPAIAIYLRATGADKAAIRATIFVIYAFSYTAAIAMQGYFNGIGDDAFTASLWLLPIVVGATYVGNRLSGKLSEQVFQKIISLLLIIVALYLFYSAL